MMCRKGEAVREYVRLGRQREEGRTRGLPHTAGRGVVELEEMGICRRHVHVMLLIDHDIEVRHHLSVRSCIGGFCGVPRT
jgi:hypothetical protein